jgi:hypothetical protein
MAKKSKKNKSIKKCNHDSDSACIKCIRNTDSRVSDTGESKGEEYLIEENSNLGDFAGTGDVAGEDDILSGVYITNKYSETWYDKYLYPHKRHENHSINFSDHKILEFQDPNNANVHYITFNTERYQELSGTLHKNLLQRKITDAMNEKNQGIFNILQNRLDVLNNTDITTIIVNLQECDCSLYLKLFNLQFNNNFPDVTRLVPQTLYELFPTKTDYSPGRHYNESCFVTLIFDKHKSSDSRSVYESLYKTMLNNQETYKDREIRLSNKINKINNTNIDKTKNLLNTEPILVYKRKYKGKKHGIQPGTTLIKCKGIRIIYDYTIVLNLHLDRGFSMSDLEKIRDNNSTIFDDIGEEIINDEKLKNIIIEDYYNNHIPIYSEIEDQLISEKNDLETEKNKCSIFEKKLKKVEKELSSEISNFQQFKLVEEECRKILNEIIIIDNGLSSNKYKKKQKQQWIIQREKHQNDFYDKLVEIFHSQGKQDILYKLSHNDKDDPTKIDDEFDFEMKQTSEVLDYILTKSIESQKKTLTNTKKRYKFTKNLYNESSEKINEIEKSIEILMTTIQNPDEYKFIIINDYIENIKVNGIKKVYAGDLNLRCDRFKQQIIKLLNSDNLKLVCNHLDYIIIKILH